MLGRYSFVGIAHFVHPDKDSKMNMKTLLLYAAIACGAAGTGALVLPHLLSPTEVQTSEETGTIQRRGPAPIRSVPQGF